MSGLAKLKRCEGWLLWALANAILIIGLTLGNTGADYIEARVIETHCLTFTADGA